MKDDLEKTRKVGLEHGFILCSRHTPEGDILTERGSCIGTTCDISLRPICGDKSEKFVGTYHTHPGETSLISEIDMKESCNGDISCIGGDEDNKLSCFVTKKNIDNDMCRIQADTFFRENLSINNESDKIDTEKEILSKIIGNYNRKVLSSKGYSRDLEIAEKSLRRLHDGLNARIKKNNSDIDKYWKFRHEITDKYFDTYSIK